MDAEGIFRRVELHSTKPAVLRGTPGAVDYYCPPTKNFYKNANKINLQEILKGFLPIKPLEAGRRSGVPANAFQHLWGAFRGRRPLRFENHFSVCVFGFGVPANRRFVG